MENETDETRPAADDEQSLASLLRLAGERPDVPLGIESRVYHRVHQEWQRSSAEPDDSRVYANVRKAWRRDALRGTLLRWLLPAGVAATITIAAFLVQQPAPEISQTVATVARVNGASASHYAEGVAIRAGETITTGPGEGISLLLARNESLRIDADSRVRVDSAHQFTLLRGRIYADSGQFVYRNDGLEIHTDLGIVTDVGTQFAVMADAGVLDVAVREGRVNVQGEAELHTAKMGERLVVTPGAEPTIEVLDPHDDFWNWAAGLAPGFDTSNKSLLDFLKWAARETGRELLFGNDASRMFAMRTDVHGSIAGLTPDEALAAVLATTTVNYHIEKDKIVIDP